MTLPNWLAKSDHAGMLQGLLLVAHSDSKFTDDERQALIALALDLGLTPSREELDTWMKHPPTAEEVGSLVTDTLTQAFLLWQALLLCHEDGDYAEAEKALIANWAKKWQFDEVGLKNLETQVKWHLLSKPPGIPDMAGR